MNNGSWKYNRYVFSRRNQVAVAPQFQLHDEETDVHISDLTVLRDPQRREQTGAGGVRQIFSVGHSILPLSGERFTIWPPPWPAFPRSGPRVCPGRVAGVQPSAHAYRTCRKRVYRDLVRLRPHPFIPSLVYIRDKEGYMKIPIPTENSCKLM